MAGMAYDEAATDRLESIYRGRDVVNQRAHTIKMLNLAAGERVLDIGSGPGFLAAEIGACVGPGGCVRGVDLSAVMIERASRRNNSPWIDFAVGDASHLDEPDGAFDAVVSTQVAEYIPDVASFCAEAFRVLRPGGRAVVLATDWDVIAWYSAEPVRMQSVLAAFAPHCAHTQLPRTLARRLRTAGFDIDRVSTFPILNTAWDDEAYSCQAIPFIMDYVRARKTVSAEILEAWAAEQRALGQSGDYFFLSNRVFFEAHRPG